MQLTWDLTEFYKTSEQVDSDINMVKRLGEKIIQTKGSLSTKQSVLNYLSLSEKYSKVLDKLEVYLLLSKSLDGSSVYVIEKLAELEHIKEKIDGDTTFVMQELKKIPNTTLKKWSTLPEFKDYDLILKDIIKAKKHTLSEKEEKIMVSVDYTTSHYDLFQCLDNVELDFGSITDEDGNRVHLTNGNYRKYAKSNVKRVRKSAFLHMIGAYKAVNQTLSTNFLSFVKFCNFKSTTFKYKNTLDSSLQGSDLPADLPKKVVENVNTYLPLLHKYYLWRKKFMKLSKFENCDTGCDLFKASISKEYPLKEGLSLIKKSLSPLGKDYTDMLDYACQNHWIDSIERPNKESGGYQVSVNGYHPFIMFTYNNTFDSVNTLAHEFGHAMNSYYTQNSQPYTKQSTGLFLAEIASTVNEILLSHYNIKNAKSKEDKINFICKFFNNFIGSVFTQSMYTEFELYVHECINIGEPLSYQKLNDFYKLLLKKYYGKNVSVLDDAKYLWSCVPHFYYVFYVYKYVTGFISACAIANNLLNNKDYVNKYKEFLSLGCSKVPLDALKVAEVNILDKKTYDSAFKLFEEYLEELKTLS